MSKDWGVFSVAGDGKIGLNDANGNGESGGWAEVVELDEGWATLEDRSLHGSLPRYLLE